MKRIGYLLVIIILICSASFVQAAPKPKGSTPLGPEFQINSTPYETPMYYNYVSVASADDGSFVTVWSGQSDGSGQSIIAKKFDVNGNPIGTEFQVNTYTLDDQRAPAIAMNNDGSFVVAWASYGQDGSGYGIFAQQFDSNANPIGVEFQVNTLTDGHQGLYVTGGGHPAHSLLSVAMSSNGNFVITWRNGNTSGGNYKAQLFHSNGAPLGTEVQVNTSSLNSIVKPDVAMSQDGTYIITYTISTGALVAQRFDANGAHVGSEFPVSDATEGGHVHPAIAMASDGSFIVTWRSEGLIDYGSIHARRFAVDGTPLNDSFLVGDTENYGDALPDVAIEPDGSFVITWTNKDDSFCGIAAQQYAASGKEVGRMFQVNETTSQDQRYSAIAAPINDTFVIVWLSNYQSPDSSGNVFARIYVP